MNGALMAGGNVVGVMADSLEKAALSRDNREPLMDGRLVLISPYDPAAGLNVGHAMQRNKLIYALADAALIVTSDFEKGGTWAGATEQLDRLRFVPLFVRNGANTGKGNSALLTRGARPWPNPQNASELRATLENAADLLAAEPKQITLALALQETPAAYEVVSAAKLSEGMAETMDPATTDAKPSPDAELWHTLREILRRELVEPRTEEEVATLLAITKPQARAWLARLVAEAVIEKVKKSTPARFRTVSVADRLI